ncbi:MAG: CDP-alcohol phosphatidyltransferase family protein [Actinomycetota bacterium]|nr:CDP-alcohol phosphatidyltransferase family protein [Actinomycetota bacterium]
MGMEGGGKQSALNIANILTLFRIVLIPCFLTAVAYRSFRYALYIFVAAAISDKLDGMAARLTRKGEDIGTFLDPLADKIMLSSTFILFLVMRLVPVWLAILVLSRDIIIVVGLSVLSISGKRPKVSPTRAGKLATAVQFTFLTVILIRTNFNVVPPVLETALALAAAILTAISGLQYMERGLRLARGRSTWGRN